MKTQVAQLYAAFFNRAPDAAGFSYWLDQLDQGKVTLAKMAADWSGSQAETAARYPSSMSTSEFVDAIYGNVLGRGADAAGKAFWTNSLATGALSRDGFIQEFVKGALAGDAQYLGNKAEVGTYFAQSGNNNFAQAVNILKLVTSDGASVAAAKAMIDGAALHAGTVMDGYISGATVFLDTNFNGRLDAGEASTTSNGTGGFTLTGGIGQIVAVGGTDVTTGAASKAVLTAPIGASLVSPITTLVAQTAAGGLSTSAAESLVQKTLGISGNIDLLNDNPLSIIASPTATGAQQATALNVQAINIQLNNIFASAVAALQGAGETLDAATVAQVVAQGAATLAQQIKAAAAAGTTVDLSGAALIQSMLTASAAGSSSAGASAALIANAQSIATVLAENNGRIASQVHAVTADTVVAALVEIAKIQEFVQDAFGHALSTAGTSMSSIIALHTGFMADLQIQGSTIGVIDTRIVLPEPPTVPEVNVAPTIAGVPQSAAAVTTGVAAGLANFTVADSNAGDSLSVTLTATNGVINGLVDADTNLAGIQLAGATAGINTALAGATFTAAADGAASIAISVSDGHAAPVSASYGLTASMPTYVSALSLSGKTISITADAGSTLKIMRVYSGEGPPFYSDVTSKFNVAEVTPGHFTAVAKDNAYADLYPETFTVKATDAGGHVGAPFASWVTGAIDSTPPKAAGGSFVEAANSTITIAADSAVLATDLTGVTVLANGTGSNIATGISASGSNITLTTTAALGSSDFVKIVYDKAVGHIADATGNQFTTAIHYIGGTGNNVISAAGDTGGARIDGSIGADDLTGGTGADQFNLGNDASADVVHIAPGDAVRAVIDLTQSPIPNMPVFLNYLDTFKGPFDTITNMKAGDTLDIQGVTLTQEMRDGSANVGTYQAIMGRWAGTTFTADDSSNADLLILWNDGVHDDNAVVLIGIWDVTGIVIG